jgi:hypothetical protein
VTTLADIGRDALIYGLPAVDLYRALHRFSLNPSSAEYRGPLNEFHHDRHLATSAARPAAAANADTLCSYAWLDLRGGPVALQMPDMHASPRISAQMVDLYGYILGRELPAAGNDYPGELVVVGPDHSDTHGAEGVHCPTQLCVVQIMTEVGGSENLRAAHAVQDAMMVRPHLGADPSPLTPAPEPVDVRHQPTIEFLNVLNWMLYLMPVLPEEGALRAELAAVGIGGVGLRAVLEEPAADLELLQGLVAGLEAVRRRAEDTETSEKLIGTRETLGTDYLTRAAGAYLGLLGGAPVG